jgi:phosphoglycerol transferase
MLKKETRIKNRYINLITPYLLITLIITTVWCFIYNRMELSSWTTPIVYGGDLWLGASLAKAFADGNASLFLFNYISELNAPFTANWNDYPITAAISYAIPGWLSHITGFFPALNLSLLLAHILAGISFWYVGTKLNYNRYIVFSCSIIFAFSHYSFVRGLAALDLIYYFHIPLLFFIFLKISDSGYILSKKQIFSFVLIAFITGFLNPYYTWIILQGLFFVLLSHLINRQHKLVLITFGLTFTVLSAFFLINANHFIYSIINGSNPHAVVRNLAGLEIYGLKLAELFIPPSYHRWNWWAIWGQTHYFHQDLAIRGEMGGPYLGIAGIAGFIWVIIYSIYQLFLKKYEAVPIHFWMILWIVLYSLIGGINHVMGTTGFILFRATNRYSIVILAISLLFISKQLTRYYPEKYSIPLALLILGIGLWDQLPPRMSMAQIHATKAVVESDQNFVRNMETILSEKSMVFQLPVMDFPEVPPIHNMPDYSHFRPYFFSEQLHFSYGSHKGRTRERWQHEIIKLPPVQLAEQLEKYGFSAIYINRNGYKDQGNNMIDQLVNSGRKILAESSLRDLVLIKLNPSATPILPAIPPYFKNGWSEDEITHRWSVSKSAEIEFFNSQKPKSGFIEFALWTLKPRTVEIFFNSNLVKRITLSPEQATNKIRLQELSFNSGKNILIFETDIPPAQPGNGDPRYLSFGVAGFKFRINK